MGKLFVKLTSDWANHNTGDYERQTCNRLNSDSYAGRVFTDFGS